MNMLVYVFLVVAVTLTFILKTMGLPRTVSARAPELLAVFTFIVILGYAAIYKRHYLPSKYIVLFLLYALLIISGIIINEVPPGVIISGISIYLKYIPFFLIPIVYKFTQEDIEKQLKLVFLLALLQLPLSFYQRLVQYKGILTGDLITGTVIVSSALSIFLICAISILVAYYLYNKLDLKKLLVLIFLLFLPTTINETKGTLVFLPLALIFPILLNSSGAELIKKLVPITFSGVLFVVVFVGIYDYFMGGRWEEGIMSRMTDPAMITHYLYSGEVSREDFEFEGNPELQGESFSRLERDAPRIDSILIPLHFLSENPVSLVIGLGIGNVTPSRVEFLSGEYGEFSDLYSSQRTTWSQILWEMGLGGVFLSMVLFYMIISDSNFVRKSTSGIAPLALGWLAVALILFLALSYKNFFNLNVINYLFWYFSGVIVSESYRIRRVSFHNSSAR